MISLERCNRLLDEGFSLITVSDNKIPNIKWKEYQSKAIDKKDFESIYKLDNTDNVGLVTGYDYLEAIDIDLKVFSTAKERLSFWEEYLSFLKDNILDFDEKFVIYKTKNAGFHILYKSKRVTKNTKIATLKGHEQAVIETRGVGGYVFVYDEKNLTKKTYKDIDFISDEDREILWACSESYNYQEPKEKVEIKKESKNYSNGLKPWEDFNNKNSVLDIVGHLFDVVRNLKDKYIIKRHGGESVHSGYIYKDNGCMFLHSTGTIFEHEKQVSAFDAYTILNHNGNYSESAKEIYKQGYGERLKPDNVLKEVNVIKKDVNFPLEIFPEPIQQYISECARTLNSSIDYMGCSMLWIASIIIGNSLNIEVKKGWKETANLWIALVGKAGIGKTPSISNITFPLAKMNSKEIKRYIKESAKYDDFKSMDKMEQELSEKVIKPKKNQFIVNDITLEALVELHSENKNGVGVLKDELAGWFKDMNKYRQGSDLEHWLSSWSGKEVNLNRKTAKSGFIEKAFIPIMGGIQPNIMDNFYTEENKDNGFIDRMLFSFPELTVEAYNEQEMKQEFLTWYEEVIINFYQEMQKIIEYTPDGEIEPRTSFFSDEAKKEWIRIFNKITSSQNSDNENEYMKSMLPKQKSYIPRFSLIINTLMAYNATEGYSVEEINKQSVLDAEKLSEYFILMSKKIKNNSIEVKGIKKLISKNEDKSDFDKFKAIYSQNEKISKSKLADMLNISRTTVYRYIKDYETTNK